MGLVEGQKFLAQIYTNQEVRASFFVDPQGVGKEFGLSVEEVNNLAQLSVQQVNFFASYLRNKRLNEVCKLLPLTYKVLGKVFIQLFGIYAQNYVPKGIKKHRNDAIAFSHFIEQVASSEKIEPLWVLDLLRYETIWLKVADPSCRWQIFWFRHSIKDLAKSVKINPEKAILLRQTTLAVWFRFSKERQLRHIILSLPPLSIDTNYLK
ncbi:MAG: hypothetical protein F6K10_28300 [Moorea sp. SIO2B7]|nr:hypothetical protein [Moorena sp. SIO2B7]